MYYLDTLKAPNIEGNNNTKGDGMNTNICAAIAKRAVIQFYYDGGTRTVEPHCHGTSRSGNEVLRGYQIAGHSESGNSVEWKLYDASKISSLVDTGKTFLDNRPGYNPSDKGMSSIHCHV